MLTAQLVRGLGTRPLGEVEAARQANARQLAPGHCVEQLPPDGVVDRVTVVPCAEPHEAEVVASLELDDGDWPGAREVRRTVERYCEMDAAQLEAGHRAVVWTPGEEGWGQGDRTGLCLAQAPQGAVVGSWHEGTPVTPAP
nr:septum formation family protein [Cellulomonas sp. APG4]